MRVGPGIRAIAVFHGLSQNEAIQVLVSLGGQEVIDYDNVFTHNTSRSLRDNFDGRAQIRRFHALKALGGQLAVKAGISGPATILNAEITEAAILANATGSHFPERLG